MDRSGQRSALNVCEVFLKGDEVHVEHGQRGIQLPSPQLTAHSMRHFVFTTAAHKRRSFSNQAKTKVTLHTFVTLFDNS